MTLSDHDLDLLTQTYIAPTVVVYDPVPLDCFHDCLEDIE